MNGNDKEQSAWKMLSPPRDGWTSFRLEGFERTYRLSDLWAEDLAFDWIDHAICGLKTQSPFCVKGSLEALPDRMLCLVNTRNCRVLVDYCDQDCLQTKSPGVVIEGYSPTTMVEFCQNLYEDVRSNIDGWVEWVSCEDPEERRRQLVRKLDELKEQIELNGDELF